MATSKTALFLKEKAVPIAFANIYIIWGSTFLAVAYGLQGFPPFILSGFRFLAAGLLLLGWRHLKGERNYSWKNWGRNAMVGILILAGGTGVVAWCEQWVSSTEAAIAIATGPFWFIAIDKKNWKQYFSNKLILAGLLIGFLGLLLFLKGSVSEAHAAGAGSFRILAFVLLALSSISWVLGSLFSRNYPASNSTVMNSAQQLIAAGVASLIISTVRSEWTGFSLSEVPANAWGGLLFLILFGSIVAYLSYIWLLGVRPPALVSTHTYVNPVVAVLVGWLFTGSTIGFLQTIGLVVILAGVLFTNAKSYKISVRRKVRYRRLFRRVKGSPQLLLSGFRTLL